MLQSSSLSTCCPVVGLCVNSYLLQEEASMRSTEALNNGYSSVSLGAILLLCSFNKIIVVGFPNAKVHDLFSLRFLAISVVSYIGSISQNGSYVHLKNDWLLL